MDAWLQVELGLCQALSLRKQGWYRCMTRPASTTRLQELPQWGTIVVVAASFDVVLLLWIRPLRALDMTHELPRSYLPLTEDWDVPLVEWALVTDDEDEEDENLNNEEEEPAP